MLDAAGVANESWGKTLTVTVTLTLIVTMRVTFVDVCDHEIGLEHLQQKVLAGLVAVEPRVRVNMREMGIMQTMGIVLVEVAIRTENGMGRNGMGMSLWWVMKKCRHGG